MGQPMERDNNNANPQRSGVTTGREAAWDAILFHGWQARLFPSSLVASERGERWEKRVVDPQVTHS